MTKDRSFLFLGRRWLILEEAHKIGDGEGYDYGEEDEKNGVFFSPERVLRLEEREALTVEAERSGGG